MHCACPKNSARGTGKKKKKGKALNVDLGYKRVLHLFPAGQSLPVWYINLNTCF